MNKACDFVKFLDEEGVELFLEDTPVDKTQKKEIKKSANINGTKIERPKENDKTSQDLSGISSLEELKQAIDNFNHPLKTNALNMVFSRGNSEKPKIMFIGEAPGQDEDIQGTPFVGKAGQLLDKMITAMKLEEKDFYITNVVNYRPENNRTPDEKEIEAFLPYLKKHIELIKPEFICILGAVSLKALFPNAAGITKSRGQWMEFEGIKTMPTYHPAYLLRFPSKKKEAWEDLQKLMKEI